MHEGILETKSQDQGTTTTSNNIEYSNTKKKS